MKRTKITCPECGQEISKSNFSKHQRRHQDHPETFEIPRFKLNHEGLDCQFCGKTCKNRNSLCNHERQCNQNPNKQMIYRPGFNDFGRPAWNKGLTKETSEGVLKHSESLKRYYENNPNHYSGGIRKGTAKKCKYGTYKGFYCDSGWELAFLVYHLDHDIDIGRNGDYFEYTYNEKAHKYYPDFIIGDTYYEIKGIYRENDQAKIDQFPNDAKLVVIDSKHIDIYVKYCEHKYGKDYAKILYDRNYSCWLDNVDKADKDYNFKLDNKGL